MSDLEISERTDTDTGSVFECERCGSVYLVRAVTYNELGYAVCPACQYDHGPKSHYRD